MANEGEGADPSGDVEQQNPGGTTTADLVRQGGDQDPAAPDRHDPAMAGSTKITGPGAPAPEPGGSPASAASEGQA